MKNIYDFIMIDILTKLSVKYGFSFEREKQFNQDYKYRFDYAIPDLKIAIEIEGGIYVFGRHNIPTGYTEDCIKYNIAQNEGWVVYRFTTEQIKRRLFTYPTKQKPNRKIITIEEFLEDVIVRRKKEYEKN